MGYFSKNKEVPKFQSKSEAFDYMFSELVSKGKDMMDAAEQASSFADIIADNKKLPDTTPKEMNGIEKGFTYVKQIATLKNENPEVWDLITGTLGSLISGFTGGGNGGTVKIEGPVMENIDFNNLE